MLRAKVMGNILKMVIFKKIISLPAQKINFAIKGINFVYLTVVQVEMRKPCAKAMIGFSDRFPIQSISN